ncbi:MAG TPA: hypothetical protein VLA16_15120 [Ideonella sp.]|nr:hypothetical protein [Ideonella sp.]
MEPTSKAKLFIHIGQTKTGSTTLQAFMHANREALKWRGLLYPGTPGKPSTLKHRFLIESVHRASEGSGAAEAAWSFLAEQIDRQRAPINVVSEEEFWHLFEERPSRRRTAIQWIAQRLEAYDVRVVCYLRRQSDWVESWFNQIVKTDVTPSAKLSFEEFIARQSKLGLMDYQKVLGDWSEVFGADHIIVRPWERERLLRGDIVDDFCALVGLQDTQDLKRPDNQQSRLSAPALEAMLAFNRQSGAAAYKGEFIKAILEEPGYQADDRRSVLTSERAAEIDARHAETNRQVARTFCGTDELFGPPSPEGRLAYAGLTSNELIDMAARLFIVQQRTIDALSARLDKLEAGR